MTCLIGVDVGGTKCAAGVLLLDRQHMLWREQIDTVVDSQGLALQHDLVALVRRAQRAALEQGYEPQSLGIGLPELVSPQGQVLSQATLTWQQTNLAAHLQDLTGLPTVIEADVRAAALGEALWGAGRSDPCFLYVTIGTGISASLVWHSRPFIGSRGLTGTFASAAGMVPDAQGQLSASLPLERYSSGPALARRLQGLVPEFHGAAPDVLAAAAAGDSAAAWVVDSAGQAVGSAVAQLVNMLDPNQVILGGGLGLAPGRYRQALELALRESVWSDLHRAIPLVTAHLHQDAGWVGAALATQSRSTTLHDSQP